MSNNTSNEVQIHGTVAPGFESVKALYEQNMRTLAERQTQLCVYHKGEKVVDLWASTEDVPGFSPDSLINVFSSGKSLEAIAMAWLVSQGLLDYNATVTHYWPEFGANGKEALTVADLMRHEAGLAAFNASIDPVDLHTENIKQNKVGRLIESHSQKFREGGNEMSREYHAVTRGWVVNEVFRRIDPAGRTIGEFLTQEIRGPLGADVIVGVKAEDLGRVVPVSPLKAGFQFVEGLKPKFLGRKMEHNIFQTTARLLQLIPNMRKGTTRGAPPPFIGMDRVGFFNDPSIVMGETPSANANCSARGLAKVAAMMSLGGKMSGVEFISADAWTALHAEPDTKDMGFGTTTFTQGGLSHFSGSYSEDTKRTRAFNSGREGFYGWMGLGGSLFQWHPEHQIGFGYVPTSLNVLDLYNERGKTYQAEVLNCVNKLSA